MLLHHVVEDWCDSAFGKFWIGHPDDCLESAHEDARLLLHNTKPLILNFDGAFSETNLHIVVVEMACKRARSE